MRKKYLLAILMILSILPLKVQSQALTNAYCWEAPSTTFDNMIPFCWVGTYTDSGKKFKIDDIDGIAAHLESMPEGKRCIFLSNQHLEMVNFPADQLKDSLTGQVQGFTDTLGVFQPYPTVWWDEGAAYVGQLHNNLFEALAEASAPLDMVVLDFETNISNWSLTGLINGFSLHSEDKDLIVTNFYKAIMADTRVSSLTSALGFDNLLKVKYWGGDNGNAYLIFNHYWWQKRTEYIETGIVAPLIAHYPMAKFSNYGDFHISAQYPVPDINGHQMYCCGHTGTHTGTHQSESYYGWLNQISYSSLPEGVTSFPRTPYNALIYSANSMKSRRLSNPAPLIGWVAYPSFQENNIVTYENSPYYFENIFHLLLSGSDDVLYWNPKHSWGPPDEIHKQQAKQVSDALHEFDAYWMDSVPQQSLFYPADNITAWNAPFVLTGMESDSVVLWRFSPRLDAVYSQPEDFLIAGTDSLTFSVHGTIQTFPKKAVIVPVNLLSDVGLWIMLDKKVGLPVSVNREVYKNTSDITLFQNYPNPFSNQTVISWQTEISGHGKLEVFDIAGKKIETLVDGYIESGKHNINFNSKGLPGGVYYYQLKVGNHTSSNKMVIINSH